MRAGVLCIALAVQLVHALADAGTAKELAKPDYQLYHTKDGVAAAARAIVDSCPTIMAVEDRFREIDGYNATITVITVEPGGLTADHANKTRLLLNYGEHGRELISSELALSLLYVLCNQSSRASLVSGYKIPRGVLARSLPQTVFKIIPMENVHGRELVEGGQLCERKNGRGVDPNRNWRVHWGHKEPDYDPKEEFPGKEPFSEPEAAILKDLAQEYKPHAWVNVHSGMEALFIPFDHKASIPEGEAGGASLAVAQELNDAVCGGRYLAHGTATDFMHAALHVPLAMTWEVYGDANASYYDCFRMFNPVDRAAFNKVIAPWTAAVFSLLTKLEGLLAVHERSEGATGGVAVISATATTAASEIQGTAPLVATSEQQQQLEAGPTGVVAPDTAQGPDTPQNAELPLSPAQGDTSVRADATAAREAAEVPGQPAKDAMLKTTPKEDLKDQNTQSDQRQHAKQQQQQETKAAADVAPPLVPVPLPPPLKQRADIEEIELLIPRSNVGQAQPNTLLPSDSGESRVLGRKEGPILSGGDAGVDDMGWRDWNSLPWLGVLLTSAVIISASYSRSRRGGKPGFPRRSPSPNRVRRKRTTSNGSLPA